MASKAAMLRKLFWWMGVIGMALQVIGSFIRARTAGFVLQFIGLGLFFLWLKWLYDNSESRKTESYELFPKRARTP
jgi:uncharacterized membrane protein